MLPLEKGWLVEHLNEINLEKRWEMYIAGSSNVFTKKIIFARFNLSPTTIFIHSNLNRPPLGRISKYGVSSASHFLINICFRWEFPSTTEDCAKCREGRKLLERSDLWSFAEIWKGKGSQKWFSKSGDAPRMRHEPLFSTNETGLKNILLTGHDNAMI